MEYTIKIMHNTTNIPAHIIAYFLRDLGLSKADTPLTIEYGDCNELDNLGICYPYNGGYIIELSNQATIGTLAHELKHVEQYVSGLGEWIEAEESVSEYDDRWHEEEAEEYGKAWEGKSI